MHDERDDDRLGGGGPPDLAPGVELSDAPGGSGPAIGGGGGDVTGDDTLDDE